MVENAKSLPFGFMRGSIPREVDNDPAGRSTWP